jgi:hypothetical protein
MLARKLIVMTPTCLVFGAIQQAHSAFRELGRIEIEVFHCLLSAAPGLAAAGRVSNIGANREGPWMARGTRNFVPTP